LSSLPSSFQMPGPTFHSFFRQEEEFGRLLTPYPHTLGLMQNKAGLAPVGVGEG
jgi:hypothetical protein